MNPQQIIAYFSNLGVDRAMLAQADPKLLAAIYTAVAPEAGGGGAPPQDAEERGVFQHASKFSEVFNKAGVGPAGMLRAFRSARRGKPSLTADEYLRAGRGA